MQRSHGFTLIEMVVALTVSAIVVGFVTVFLATPVQAYMAQRRRAELTDSADAAARWIARDVRTALPNSLRQRTIGSRRILEMIEVTAVTIYRDAGNEGDTLRFTSRDSQFDVLGAPNTSFRYVVVNNEGTGNRNAYRLRNVIARGFIGSSPDRIRLVPSHRFPRASPRRRAFLVDRVTRYECDLAAGTLRRYTDLPITRTIGLVSAPSTLIASGITGCVFQPSALPTPASQEHGGMLSLQLTLSRAAEGTLESVRVMQQIAVENAS